MPFEMTRLPELDEMVARLVGERFGTLRVVDAFTDYRYDHDGDEAVYVTLILPNSDGPAWPTDDALGMYWTIDGRIGPLADRKWYIIMRAEVDEPQEEDAQLAGLDPG